MKLISLQLSNFKGLEKFSINPDGGNLVVVGDNGTGKTTLLDAYLWLLFNVDSTGRSNPDVRPSGGCDEDTVVEAKFEGNNGGELFLDKAVTSSGAVIYWIDGRSVNATHYQAVIATAFKSELSTPWKFHQLHWKDRRAVLEQVAGMTELSELEAKRKEADKDAKNESKTLATREVQVDALARAMELVCQPCHENLEVLRSNVEDVRSMHLDDKEAAEKKLDEAEDAITRATSRLQEAASSGNITWKMAQDLKNGGTAPTCELIYQGVPWSYLNHAKQIEAGLELVAMLSERLACPQPCWVDNAEAITQPSAPEGVQTIWLKARRGKLKSWKQKKTGGEQ